MRVCILLRKLTFLVKLLQSTSDNLSSHVFHTLASKDVSRISLVEQCQLLECDFGTSFVTQCLNDPENAHSVLGLYIGTGKLCWRWPSVTSRLSISLTLELPPHGASYGTSL